MKNRKKILLTGGHFTAGIAVYNELIKKNMFDIVWAGHKYTMLFDKEPSAEYLNVTKLGIKFYDIKAGKIYRYFSWKGIISLLRIPLGFIQSLFLILSEKPDLIISFGGYISVPICLTGKLLGVRYITHEQTSTEGLANKLLSRFADKVMVAWPDSSLARYNNTKITITGNPVRSEIYIKDHPFVYFNVNLPTILIMGGNQGSHLLNLTVLKLLPLLENKFNVIHSCGSNSIYNDYELLKKEEEYYINYKVFKGIWGEDSGRAFNQSDVVITRSGANTVYELAILSKPCILVPLSYAVNNEQYKNAEKLKDLGLGFIIEEKDLSADSLYNAILERNIFSEKLKSDENITNELNKNIQNIIIFDAASRIVQTAINILNKRGGREIQ